MSLKIFLHGLKSTNQGTKSVFFRRNYPDMIIPNLFGSLEQRMKMLRELLADKSDISIVGSSFGGLMATVFSMENEFRVDRMILLAPAINLLGFSRYRERKISVPVTIFHGRNDDVIPFQPMNHVAERCFQNLSLHIADDDHSLHDTFSSIDWVKLLGR